MGTYLNPGSELFKIATNSKIYVDKTMLIKYTNEHILTSDRYMAVSRPRRFGKTMAMDMLCAYYGRGEAAEELFKKYDICSDESFKKHLNKYNVIKLNIRDAISKSETVGSMTDGLTKRIVYELKNDNPEITLFDETDITQCISDIYESTRTAFVFLIDEWDAVFRIKGITEEEQVKYLDFLRNLLKDKAYVALAYMTGILPIKKYGEHSALNMFTEYSMTNQRELAEYTGFTKEEVQGLCKAYNMSYDETKRWYDGYCLRDISVYNPRSVVMSMTGHDYDSYWTKTETYEALRIYIEMNFDGLRDAIIELMAGEKLSVDTRSFANDMVNLTSRDDVLTLLIHLGYLTYDFDTKRAWIPNQEIMGEYASTIKTLDWSGVTEALKMSDELLKAVFDKDNRYVESALEKIHSFETSILTYNDENALASVISIAFYTARREYDMVRELPAGKGYADICFIPKRGSSKPAMIVELKVDKTAESAITQIKERKYIDGLKSYSGKVILVGISYDRKSKRHSCGIEEVFKE